MQNAQAFAVKGAFAATPAARAAFAADLAVQPAMHMSMARAAGATTPAAEIPAIAMRRRIRVDDIFVKPHRPIDPRVTTPRPNLPLRREELTIPAAPTATPADTDVFAGKDGSRLVLPRYALAFDKVGLVEEPRIAIVDRHGTPTLVLTLNEIPSPAAGDGTSELQHVLAVTLKYRVPVVGGGDMVQAVPFPTVLLDTTETVVTADGQLIQQAPVDGEETLIGVGQGI